jgi:hypothetical protein
MTRMQTRVGAQTRRIVLELAVAAAVAALAALPARSFAQGCAMCGTYLSNGADPRSDAFKVSIMFLMCMPFLTVLSAGGWILWMHWRSRPRRPALRVLHAEEEGAS